MSIMLKESVVRLPDIHPVEDPREVAGDLTQELAQVTTEKLRLHAMLDVQPSKMREISSQLSALNRRIVKIHAQIEHLSNRN